MRFLEKQFKRFAKKFWLPANTTACVCARARAPGKHSDYASVQWDRCVCCCMLLSFSFPFDWGHFHTSINWGQLYTRGCFPFGSGSFGLINILRAQQFHFDVKQNNWLRSVGWQGLIWMFFFSTENTINYVVRNNIRQMLCPTTGAISCTSIAHTVLYKSVFVWGV